MDNRTQNAYRPLEPIYVKVIRNGTIIPAPGGHDAITPFFHSPIRSPVLETLSVDMEDNLTTRINTALLGIAGKYEIGIVDTHTCAFDTVNVTVSDLPVTVLTNFGASASVFALGIVIHMIGPRIIRKMGAVGHRIPSLPTMSDIRKVFSFDLSFISISVGRGAGLYLGVLRMAVYAGAFLSLIFIILTILNATAGQAAGVGKFASLTNAHLQPSQVC